jgi:hypothetical protein
VDISCDEWPHDKRAGLPALNHYDWWHQTLTRIDSKQIPPIRFATLAFDSTQTGRSLRNLLTLLNDPESEAAGDQNHLKALRVAIADDVALQTARSERFEKIIKVLKDLREGAFRPLHENPIAQALLIPAGGLGSLQVFAMLR